jgi:phage-related protein
MEVIVTVGNFSLLGEAMAKGERQEKEVKEIVWLGSSLEDLRKFPAEVRREIGFALDRAQRGLTHHNVKPLRGFSGVFEIKSDYDRNTYRTVYAVKLGDEIYVLHCFQKKSTRGIKTPKKEIDLIKRRLKIAQELAKEKEE